MEELLRLLAVIERDQQARDARVVIGGKPSEDPRDVELELEPGWRMVVRFDDPPPDVAAVEARVRALVETFHDAGSARPSSTPRLRGPAASKRRQQQRLDDELRETLEMLCARTVAHAAIVIDERSPVIWGASRALAFADVDDAERFARLHAERGDAWLGTLAGRPSSSSRDERSRSHLHVTDPTSRWLEQLRIEAHDDTVDGWAQAAQVAAALAQVRNSGAASGAGRLVVQSDTLGVWARNFAGIYWLVQVFPGRFSEIACEGTATKALPLIERLVLSLPPLDPEPKGGTLLAFLRSVD